MGKAGLLCAVLMLALTGAAQPLQPQSAGAVTVEAEGLAPMPAGRPLADVRGEALRDARRNAVLQARAHVETQARVAGMRLQEGLVRVRASGYVERMEVVSEGAVKGADPPVYRVRVRATVRPTGVSQVHSEPYRPVVALTLSGSPSGLDVKAVRQALAGSLSRCGVALQESGAGPALVLKMTLTPGGRADGGSTVADWELSAGPGVPAGLYLGHWEVEPEGAGPAAWERVGTIIAQDAVRLWATPRPTVVRFLKPTRDQADALTRSFGRSTETHVTVAKDGSELTVHLPIAGDPVTAADAFVAQAGLSDQAELTDASLTDLTYRCHPAPHAAAPGRP